MASCTLEIVPPDDREFISPALAVGGAWMSGTECLARVRPLAL
jgi:hypothetical protein